MPGSAAHSEAHRERCLQEDLQSQFWWTTALEKVNRGVQVNVVPHRKSTGRARFESCALELFRTPSLDALDLRLID